MGRSAQPDRPRDDDGQMIVLVLLVSVMLITSLAVALTLSQSGLNLANTPCDELARKDGSSDGPGYRADGDARRLELLLPALQSHRVPRCDRSNLLLLGRRGLFRWRHPADLQWCRFHARR